MEHDALTPAEIGKLMWRSRRGLLENDLLLERFYACYGAQLTRSQVNALTQLLALADNDLLDILLKRKSLPEALNQAPVRQMLQRLQSTVNAETAIEND